MVSQPAGTHLAQLNVGHIRYATDDPRMAEFMNSLDAVNALAERSPGFVWRFKDDASNNATNVLVRRTRPFSSTRACGRRPHSSSTSCGTRCTSAST